MKQVVAIILTVVCISILFASSIHGVYSSSDDTITSVTTEDNTGTTFELYSLTSSMIDGGYTFNMYVDGSDSYTVEYSTYVLVLCTATDGSPAIALCNIEAASASDIMYGVCEVNSKNFNSANSSITTYTFNDAYTSEPLTFSIVNDKGTIVIVDNETSYLATSVSKTKALLYLQSAIDIDTARHKSQM